ncbi:hypothetical protein PV08_02638 [Exophiala spinifera]|uniref:AB hydrolase-1 domain-containing protein n=1 Tax=Exophiala spinifera TaxID=91928 RepID=A0A0D2BIB0_9EURO|nr:uncharacterized protein PV08_02638 [Exophiala spinifera]KIW18350.1 hypothetical protein PV08_02638 [Exophiala spinifera]
MVQNLNVSAGPAPTVVIIPGSFSSAYFYDEIVHQLRMNGFEAAAYDLPSASRMPPQPAATLANDAAFFHDIAQKIADQGKDIVFVTHSYGGVVGTEASKGLTKAERQADGKEGGLVRLVYLTSVVPSVGNSLADTMGDLVPTYLKVEGEYMRHDPPEESAKLTFSDLPPEVGVDWVKKMPLHSAPSFAGKLTHPGYKYVPVSWIFCEDDLILVPEFQRNCIEMIERESGNKVEVHNLKAGHCPNASVGVETAMLITRAIKEA